VRIYSLIPTTPTLTNTQNEKTFLKSTYAKIFENSEENQNKTDTSYKFGE